MKKFYFLFILIIGIYPIQSQGSVITIEKINLKPTATSLVTNNFCSVNHIVIKKRPVEKISLIEKLRFKLIQKQIKKQYFAEDGEPTARQRKQGKLSMILGISSVVGLFIPYVNILALPAAITALVLGLKSIKGNSNTRGIVGVITGAVTLLLFIIAIIVVAAFLSSWN
jgi:hypothetical protein